jgi:Ribbon-helix-helix protein, copG family
LRQGYYAVFVKTLTVKLPDPLFAEIASAAKARKISKSAIVRERLTRSRNDGDSLWNRMEDLVIERDPLPADLSSNKAHMKKYGKNRSDR